MRSQTSHLFNNVMPAQAGIRQFKAQTSSLTLDSRLRGSDSACLIKRKIHTIFLCLACVLQLSSCGFHPVYGVNKYTAVGVEEKLAQMQISNIPDREGQYLRNALIDRFYRTGRPENPDYLLAVENLKETKSELDITKDADSTRGQLKMTATMALYDNKTQKLLLKRNLTAIASYNILSSEFTNRVSEQNTRENILNDLSRQIERQIALYFKKEP